MQFWPIFIYLFISSQLMKTYLLIKSPSPPAMLSMISWTMSTPKTHNTNSDGQQVGNEAETGSIPVNLTQPLALCLLCDRISYRAALVEIPAHWKKETKKNSGAEPRLGIPELTVAFLAHTSVVLALPLLHPCWEKGGFVKWIICLQWRS